MTSTTDWQSYVNDKGDFNLSLYIYHAINRLMKMSLDMGTLLSDDRNKLRAYKEQIKATFKDQWLDMADALEAFEILIPCGCSFKEYCTVCGGSRYLLNGALSPDVIREIAMVTHDAAPELQEKLEQGLRQAMHDLEAYTPPR